MWPYSWWYNNNIDLWRLMFWYQVDLWIILCSKILPSHLPSKLLLCCPRVLFLSRTSHRQSKKAAHSKLLLSDSNNSLQLAVAQRRSSCSVGRTWSNNSFMGGLQVFFFIQNFDVKTLQATLKKHCVIRENVNFLLTTLNSDDCVTRNNSPYQQVTVVCICYSIREKWKS